ncbi:MAG TPA: AraC family transcriptional regulator [Candidatus Acidoferrales bacterium]|nr:AraC family transcriptional regulator [Candidatus Acidoferrales bacterium]
MDPLSNVFMAMRVKTSECIRLEFSGSWGFRFDGYEHAHFGVVSRGNCWLSTRGKIEPTLLSAGDCWLLPRGDTHSLSACRDSKIRPYDDVRGRKAGGLLRYKDGQGHLTKIIVGNFTFDESSGKWLTDVLPEVITFRMDRGHSAAMPTILQILALESQTENMGSTVVVSRLADILFVQAIRAHAVQAGTTSAGWLQGLADRQLRLALRAMHEDFGKEWTVADLASVAGMSRSAFAARFSEVLRESPIEYLTRWRMHRAMQLLRDGDLKIAKVAGLVGYESDGAFNKSFKRAIGIAPGAYRAALLKAVNLTADHNA